MFVLGGFVGWLIYVRYFVVCVCGFIGYHIGVRYLFAGVLTVYWVRDVCKLFVFYKKKYRFIGYPICVMFCVCVCMVRLGNLFVPGILRRYCVPYLCKILLVVFWRFYRVPVLCTFFLLVCVFLFYNGCLFTRLV